MKSKIEDVPMVSVLTLMYNTGDYVIEALKSLRQQTVYDKTESIIIDDGSKDNSVNTVKRWIEENNFPCTFIVNEKNLGIPATLNKALRQVKGKYYTPLSDDIWLPNYLEEQLNRIEESEEDVALVFSDTAEIDQHGNVTHPSFLRKRGFDPQKIKTGFVFDDILKLSFIPAVSVVIKMSVFDEVGNYDEQLISEDYDMWLRITKKYKVIYNPNTLIQYRRHPSSFTVSGNFPMARTKLLIFKKHWGELTTKDQILLQKAKPFIYPCFKQEDKGLAMEWAKLILENTKPGLGFKVMYFLQKKDFSPNLMDLIYRVFFKLKMI